MSAVPNVAPTGALPTVALAATPPPATNQAPQVIDLTQIGQHDDQERAQAEAEEMRRYEESMRWWCGPRAR